MSVETDRINDNPDSTGKSDSIRSSSPGFDILRPWKVISQNNVYIIYLSVLLFAFYAFARHGFNWIALSTSLIASVPVGFAIAFFEISVPRIYFLVAVFDYIKDCSTIIQSAFHLLL